MTLSGGASAPPGSNRIPHTGLATRVPNRFGKAARSELVAHTQRQKVSWIPPRPSAANQVLPAARDRFPTLATIMAHEGAALEDRDGVLIAPGEVLGDVGRTRRQRAAAGSTRSPRSAFSPSACASAHPYARRTRVGCGRDRRIPRGFGPPPRGRSFLPNRPTGRDRRGPRLPATSWLLDAPRDLSAHHRDGGHTSRHGSAAVHIE